MNPGQIAYLCLFILLIMLWMGWLRSFLMQIKVKEGAFALFLALAFFFSFLNLPITGNFHINIGLFLFPILLFSWVWGNEDKDSRMNIIASCLLLGVNLFLLRYVIRIDPVLLMMSEAYMIGFVAMILVLILGKNMKQVFLITGMGLYLMEFLYQGWVYIHSKEMLWGDGVFCDALLFSLIGAVILRRAIEWVMSCLSIRFNL